ncbi:hypothetical protein E2C01_044692 [Portunus trituberculatus]|uniref:Uncharacterized protein n=1 Tax=Portunus trituberculatus TaxID=210409 RepID=A0A5B7G131_PORTR|nr:hypothetical protein [Portunus trituberculatus]
MSPARPPLHTSSEALDGILLCPRPPRTVVSKGLGGTLSCLSDALASASTSPGVSSTGSLHEDLPVEDMSLMDVPLEDMPLGAEGEVPLSDQDTAFPAAHGTKAQVPSSFLKGGVAPLRTMERFTGQCLPKRPRGKCHLNEPSLMGEERACSQATLQTVLCLAAFLSMVSWMWRSLWQELEARECDIDFLGNHILFLRGEEMHALDSGSFLGSNGNGCARLLLSGGACCTSSTWGGRAVWGVSPRTSAWRQAMRMTSPGKDYTLSAAG